MNLVTIRLIGEAEDRLYHGVPLDKKISYSDLNELVHNVTFIPAVFQQIRIRGQRLPAKEHPLESIEEIVELEVSHCRLLNWRTFIFMITEIKSMSPSGATVFRMEVARKARAQLTPLFSGNFFAVYPNLAIEEMKISKSLSFLVQNTKKYLDRSVLAYFKSAYPGRTVELKEKSLKFAGVHLGVFVFIDDEPLYYAKNLGRVPGPYEEFDFPDCLKIDLIEIYVYLLLKMIGVGPVEVHVIPDINKSDVVFIATKLIDGFRTASGVSATEILEGTFSRVLVQVYIDEDMRNQMKILSSLLCLSDLQTNKGNHGVVEPQTTNLEKKEDECTRELRIVDFEVNHSLINCELCDLKSSFDIAHFKTFSAKWDLQNNINRANEAMNNIPVLKKNKYTNRAAFDCYFKRLEKALTTFSD